MASPFTFSTSSGRLGAPPMITAGLPLTAGSRSANRAILDDLKCRTPAGLADSLRVAVPTVPNQPVPLRCRTLADMQVHSAKHAGALAGADRDGHPGDPVHLHQSGPNAFFNPMSPHVESGPAIEPLAPERQAMRWGDSDSFIQQVRHHLRTRHWLKTTPLGELQRLPSAGAD